MAELRALAQTCNFGDTLEVMLRDRLVCGMDEDFIQRRLLAEPNLTYKKALELALGLETAAKNAQELLTTAASGQAVVHKLSMSSTSQVTGAVTACWRCGKRTHKVMQCPFKDARCYSCGKMGHIKLACHSRQ